MRPCPCTSLSSRGLLEELPLPVERPLHVGLWYHRDLATHFPSVCNRISRYAYDGPTNLNSNAISNKFRCKTQSNMQVHLLHRKTMEPKTSPTVWDVRLRVHNSGIPNRHTQAETDS